MGIGASAGGLEALERLTARLAPSGMAFVVLQHLAPGHESVLTDILARGSTLKVVTIENGMKVEPNTIFVAPPNIELELYQGALRVSQPAESKRFPRHSIDAFFRSIAYEARASAVGVILSGAGSDGTLGLKAIKEEGGITFAQDPATAGQASMPQSALDAGYADFCLSPAEIGEELTRLGAHPYVARAAPRPFDEESRTKLMVLLRAAFGIDFGGYKRTTVDRRIQRRLAVHKLERLEDYLTLVSTSPKELSVLCSELLIGVTRFFRDAEPFEALKTDVLPKLLEERPSVAPLRVWVAGCSTGEEAYSVAVCILEHLTANSLPHRVQIFATDVDEQALTYARHGAYPQSIELDVSPERLQRFFTRTDKGYQVKRSVRDTVVFARHNLGKDPPFSRLDLVSCRNVLIYMQPALQRKVLRIFHYALQPGGFLLLGSSESVGEDSDLFALVDRKLRLYTRKAVTPAAVFDFALGGPGLGEEPFHAHTAPGVDVFRVADRRVLDKYGPPGVIVDEKLQVLQFRGRTGRYLEPTPGLATLDILRLARPELCSELRSALYEAFSEDKGVVSPPVLLRDGAEWASIRIDVSPLPDLGAGRSCLVLFTEEPSRIPALPEKEPPAVEQPPPPPSDVRVMELERELAATKEYLQTTVEELETTNEELQSSNEELQSSNEELQSTNEELETSKEELQSTNEELLTLNEELQNRMVELTVANDDLQNVLGTVSSTVVVVGANLRIRRFSAGAEKMLHLVPGDVGRPVAYVRTVVRARDIEHVIGEVMRTGTPSEQRVRSADGLWYAMRICPYRTTDQAVHGAVIELAPARPAGEGEDQAELASLSRSVLATLPQALAVLDERMCVVWGNGAFLDLFRAGADIFGRPLEDFWSGKEEQPELWRLLEDAAVRGTSFANVRLEAPLGAPLAAPCRFSAKPLPETDQERPRTLVIIDEIAEAPADAGE